VTLAVVALAQMANCPVCWVTPRVPCGTGWDHLARYGRAKRRGLISGDELERAAKLALPAGDYRVVWHADAGLI
jgi:hypothetical protein